MIIGKTFKQQNFVRRLNAAPGGELGGYRAKVYAGIARGANDIVVAIKSANESFAADKAKQAAKKTQ